MKPLDYMRALAETAVMIPAGPILDLVDAIREAQRNGNNVFICGNGGSAATADHMTLDFQKSIPGGVNAISLMGLSAITAYANDHGYSDIFFKQLERLAKPRDLLICISTSGNSYNVIKAAEYARSHMMTVATITAYGGGQLKKMGNIVIHAPIDNVRVAEDLHSAILHSVIDYLRSGSE